jgi:hypothetical protein
MFIGNVENLVPLIKAILIIKKAEYQAKANLVNVEIYNNSSAEYILANTSEYTFYDNIDIQVIPPHGTLKLAVKTLKRYNKFNLSFQVLNGVIAPKKHPNVTFEIDAKQ